jgi:uncharacterized phage protein gp47/JayE
MLDRLHAQRLASGPRQDTQPLAVLTTRDSDDPAIALLDAWAMVADVLTFYQERIANEGYLRTATEHRSVLELARMVGHELSPGVAASTFLAFTVEDAPGAPHVVTVPTRTKVQSIPRPGQLPQTFETIEGLEARVEWNDLQPSVGLEIQPLKPETMHLRLKGINTRLQPGDALLIVGDEREQDTASAQWYVLGVHTVESHPQADYTLVTWNKALHDLKPGPLPTNPRVFALRQRAALFGHNAPAWKAMPEDIKKVYAPDYDPTKPAIPEEWPDFRVPLASTPPSTIDLDAVYASILVGGWAVLMSLESTRLYRITQVTTGMRAEFMLNAQVTKLQFDTDAGLHDLKLRETVVLAQSEQLALAEQPVMTLLTGDTITLATAVPGLQPGRALTICGTPLPATLPGLMVSEIAMLKGVTTQGGRTALTLSAALQHQYDPATVTINANTVRATHGESVINEVLGSGSGTQTNQRFTLKKPPLTYVSAPTASGVQSTLEVCVHDVRWQEVLSLYGLTPRSQSYTVRRDATGNATVIFGDGIYGARLPSGQENVVATYRSGIGPAGMVDAGTLTLLQTRPFGIREVTNPLPATGAAAAETLAGARRRTPQTVRLLERLVSQQDIEDFVENFAGVGKAQAMTLWTGATRLVHVTIADMFGREVAPHSELGRSLVAALKAIGHPLQRLQLDTFTRRSFNVAVDIWVDPHYSPETVQAAITSTLTTAFSFAQRAFGQGVFASEVISTIHSVPGVIAVDLNALYDSANPATYEEALVARAAYVTLGPQRQTTVHPAELLVLNQDGITLTTEKSHERANP